MSPFPAIAHVAVTISDPAVSVRWYTRLIGSEPALDEDTGPFRHIVYAIGGTLLGLHVSGWSRRRYRFPALPPGPGPHRFRLQRSGRTGQVATTPG